MRKIFLILVIAFFALTCESLAFASSQITLQNNSNQTLNLFVDGHYACGPAMPSGFCTSSVTPGSHLLEARKGVDPNTTIKSEPSLNIEDGTSPTWTVNYADDKLDESRAQQAIMSFYRTRGEWAGVFVMDSILQIKSEKLSDHTYRLDVEYHYTPIPNNRLKRTDTGVDRRVFILEVFGGNYTITSMGGYESGRL